MPLNSLLVKTPSLNTIIHPPSAPSTAKKLLSSGFLSLIGRSNSSSSNGKPPTTEESKQLRRTSSTQLRAQRKAKQQTTSSSTGSNGNQRLSADVESLLPASSNNTPADEPCNDDAHAFDKAAPHYPGERLSTMSLASTSDRNASATSSPNNGERKREGRKKT